jgi:hypothetical protein
VYMRQFYNGCGKALARISGAPRGEVRADSGREVDDEGRALAGAGEERDEAGHPANELAPEIGIEAVPLLARSGL